MIMSTNNTGNSQSSTLFNAGEKSINRDTITTFSTSTDVDPNTQYSLPQYSVNVQPESDLKDFLARPVVISTINWTSGTTLNTSFKPWLEFLQNTAIKKKIDNYYLIRGVLKLKAVVTASPGLFGAAYASYQPIEYFNPAPIIETATYDGWMVPFSQRPGIDLNIEENTGGEMTLPYLWTHEWLDVTRLNTISEFGEITVRNFTPLVNVGGTAADVTIRFFAWMDEVETSVPTSQLALQSEGMKKGKGKAKKDTGEYSETDGVISKPASAVASVAGMLSEVPVIGPFAKATEMAAEGVGAVAKLFGFTNPPVLEDVKPFKNSSLPPLATTEVCHPYERLTLDSKNELTIDNTSRGYIGKDELDIETFCNRNSYLDYVTWSASDAVGTALWASRVTPELARRDGSSNYKAQPIFACVAAQCFQYWRADMVFGVRVVSSKNHTGSIRVCYDPHGDIVTSSPDFAVVTNWVLDITTDKVTEICIPMSNEYAFLETIRDPFEQRFGLGSISGAPTVNTTNGTIRVEVNTKQSCYNASADITLMFYAYAKNVQFFGPTNIRGDISWYPLQSEGGEENTGLATTDEVQEMTVSESSTENIALIYGGERNPSFRKLLQRMNYSRSTRETANTTELFARRVCVFNRYPLYLGYDPNGIDEAVGTLVPASDFPFNFVKNTPFHLITSCFAGSYGSINWNIVQDGIDNISMMHVSRDTGTLTVANYNTVSGLATTASGDEITRFLVESFGSGASGSAIAKQNLSSVSINAPYYSQHKFRFNTANRRTLGSGADSSNTDNIRLVCLNKPTSNNPRDSCFHYFFGTGPDFNCIFLLNVPTWQQNPLPAAKT